MRDMMATHERLPAETPAIAESVRRAAAAAFEALPAILLAAALLMPALAAFAGRTAERAVPAEAPAPASDVGHEIADQGNRALIEIRDDLRQGLRQNIALPKLS